MFAEADSTLGRAGAGRTAAVVGGGIVGVCCALYLQRDGWTVQLFDPLPPGTACSSGNAGVLVSGAVPPLANPDILRDLPRLITDRLSPLSIRWQYLPWLLPWLFKFIRASAPAEVEAGTAALASLIRLIPKAYEPLIAEAEAHSLVEERGQIFLFRSAEAFRKARPSLELRRRFGSTLVEVGPAEIQEIEPALAPVFAGGWHRREGGHLTDPRRFTQTLAESFVKNGGRIIPAAVSRIKVSDGAMAAVQTDAGEIRPDIVVIAAGAQSRRLVGQLGVKVPLEAERGYSVTLPEPGFDLRIPVSITEGGFFVTPMMSGIRLAGTAEFAGFDAPPDSRRYEVMLRQARSAFRHLAEDRAEKWMGRRASFPDSRPVIGMVPGVRSVLAAFGHGHLGMSLGAITGLLISEVAGERTPSAPLAPFRMERFL